MLILEHGVGSDSVLASLSSDEPSISDLRGGAALNVLSGLHAEVALLGGQEGGWLFEAVFSKTPAQVLDEAIQAALDEIGDPRLQRPSDLSVEQANLALRRRTMKAQFQAAGAAAEGGRERATQRAADECTRVQVWLESVRLHAEGWPREGSPSSAGGPAGSSATVAAPAASKDRSSKDRAAAPERTAWHDGCVLRELGRAEADLEADSQQMSLEALRAQNRAIEEYVMRLVRQRDELRSITKLAEERDSYFILGLNGPDASEDEVKRAYRNLARKEHPDKAGIGNKRRFQAIQQAYTNILRQRKGDEGGKVDNETVGAEGSTDDAAARAAGTIVTEASNYAAQASSAADRVAVCAHRTLRGGEEGADVQSLPKRRALRTLRELTRQGATDLRDAALQLRHLGQAICAVARCAEEGMREHCEWAGTTAAGVGLRDRAVIVEDAGTSARSSAELLEKISEATEATLRKVEKASPDPGGGAGEAAGSAPRGAARGEEANNLLRLGVRLLSESLARTAAVARRSADEAIAGAVKALELSRGLAALDLEARKERERRAAKRRGFGQDDEPVPAGDAEVPGGGRPADQQGGGGEDGRRAGEEAPPSRTPRSRPETPAGQTSPKDQLKSAAKRVKERHVALRVKNLRFLSNLNEEALLAQVRLECLLERGQGALLPEVSIVEKRRLFDLVAQLLEFALAESGRLAANPAAPPARVLERSLGFALALEHGKEIAMPSDSRTQALKLAGLIDTDLLCQVFDGPFRRRLLALGARRKAAADASSSGGGYAPYGRARSGSLGTGGNGATVKAWEDAVHACCARIAESIRQALAPRSAPGANGEEHAGEAAGGQRSPPGSGGG